MLESLLPPNRILADYTPFKSVDYLAHENLKSQSSNRKQPTLMYELKIVRKRRQGYRGFKQLATSQDVCDAFRERYEQADREEFSVLLLDAKNYLLGFNVVSVGSLNASIVHPREVFKAAILANAAAIILTHNHPSGDSKPSAEDISLTKQLKKAGDIIDIRVLDHIVIGDGQYYSFASNGLL